MHRIVIVEDQEIIRTTLIDTIDWASVDCEVVAQAGDGEKGLDKIRTCSPDIVITDIHLPGIDGISMLEKALESSEFQSVIISGFSQFEYAKKAISLSVVDYILKPIDEEKLLKAVGKAVERIEQTREFGRLKRIADPIYSIDILENRTSDMHLTKILEDIRKDYSKHLTLEGICSSMGMNVDYISRKLRSLSSESFPDILARHRVEVSKRMMRENTSIKYYEIAEKVGFSSYKRFSLIFKSISGQSPSEYIRSLEKTSGGRL